MKIAVHRTYPSLEMFRSPIPYLDLSYISALDRTIFGPSLPERKIL